MSNSQPMKALILAGGKGSRLRPITNSIAKQLVPVANKPVIEYGIEAIRAAGIKEFGIIVGDSEAEIRSALGDGSKWDAQFHFIRQDAPLGLAHAVKTAQPYLGTENFIMYLGDNLIKSGVTELVKEFENGSFDASILLTEVTNPSEFGVAELEGERVVRLEEKPANPQSNLALVGVYLFNSTVFAAIDTLKPSFRGELEITDAIQTLINQGKEVRSHIISGWWKDTGTVEAMLDANRLILSSLNHSIVGQVADSKVEGSVTVEDGAVVLRSTLRGPLIIGKNCLIEDAFIGPFSAIANNCTIVHSEIEYSIVMENCTIKNVPSRISGSLLGRGISVRQESHKPSTLGLVLGDGSSVTLP